MEDIDLFSNEQHADLWSLGDKLMYSSFPDFMFKPQLHQNNKSVIINKPAKMNKLYRGREKEKRIKRKPILTIIPLTNGSICKPQKLENQNLGTIVQNRCNMRKKSVKSYTAFHE